MDSTIDVPPVLAQSPPRCPLCRSLLHVGLQNHAGDSLLTCTTDGYEAVHRVATDEFDPRPGRELKRWCPPLRGDDAA